MNRKISILIFLCVAAITFEVVMLTVGAKKQSAEHNTASGIDTPNSSQTSPIVPTAADLMPEDAPQNQTATSRSLPMSSPAASGSQPESPRAAESVPLNDDAVLLQARRELRQAQTDVSIPSADAVTSSDGKIHLKSGGTISAEDWQAARNRIP